MKTLKRFTALDKNRHNRIKFDCGKSALNHFLATQAAKHMQMGISATYVLPSAEKTANGLKSIATYYTLSMGHIERTSLPNAKKFPYYPIPVVVLARLAVDKQFQGQGYGDITLIRAIRHTSTISDTIPAYAMVIDVKDNEAMKFYRRYTDFKPLIDNPERLYLPIKIAQKI